MDSRGVRHTSKADDRREFHGHEITAIVKRLSAERLEQSADAFLIYILQRVTGNL